MENLDGSSAPVLSAMAGYRSELRFFIDLRNSRAATGACSLKVLLRRRGQGVAGSSVLALFDVGKAVLKNSCVRHVSSF